MPIEPRGLRTPLRNTELLGSRLTDRMLREGIAEAYRLIDSIDATLGVHLSELVELANLSSIIGNLVAAGIVRASKEVFTRAGPHKYQDLRVAGSDADNIEIKVALEDNKPKGHLPKKGNYLTVRYVLADSTGAFVRKIRGPVPWIWELRYGHLNLRDFSISNTEGDSGKTAVVSAEGMRKLRLIYFDESLCPLVGIPRFLRTYGE